MKSHIRIRGRRLFFGVILGCVMPWFVMAEEAAPLGGLSAAQTKGGGTDLTLAEALVRTLMHNPELNAAHFNIAIAEARRLQASLRKNPEVSAEFEDVRWSRGPSAFTNSRSIQGDAAGVSVTNDRSKEQGAAPGFGEAQITVRLSQLVELGGKRIKRMRTAAKERDLARWDYETKRMDILTEVDKSFIAGLYAQETLQLAEDDAELAQSVLNTVQARVEAGRVSPIEAQKAQNALSATLIAEDLAKSVLENARVKLASAWGADPPDFGRLSGDYYVTVPVPPYEEFEAAKENNPDLARWADEMELRQVTLREQRAQRVPDLTVEMGFRSAGQQNHEQEDLSFAPDASWSGSLTESGYDSRRDSSLVFMFSLPLPLFDRNQGGIKEAELQAQRTSQMKRKAESDVNSGLRASYADLLHAESAVSALKKVVLPQAQDVFDKTEEGYRQGKFGYLDVLEAQRSLHEYTTQYLDALKEYHVAVAEVERLAGHPLVDAEAELNPDENTNGTKP